MTEVQRVVLIVAVLGVLFFSVGVGSVAADAPDCSNVNYNGDGTEPNPYEVSNVDQLQCIEEQDLDANYVQVSDIDASGTSAWNGGKGFEPIGEFDFDRDTEFTGTFDGADHTISGLTIDRGSTNQVGLFGDVDLPSGRLENVELENVDITGNAFVGGLVGDNFGTVRESYATGNVSGSGVLVGGLVGNNDGTVRESYATGNVSGDDAVGGLVGKNFGTVRESYATGTVNGDGDVGGLVGLNGNDGIIRESYAAGDVSGNNKVGGLVGRNDADGTVERSYAAGDVSGDGAVGGLVGRTRSGTVTDSYWDTQSTGQPDSEGGTGLTTSEMTGSAATNNMQGFDFTSTWETVTNPDDYPILAFQTEDDPPNFEVSIAGTNSPVAENETLTVTGTIENTGDESDTQDIIASAGGLGSITRTVMLNAGESTTEMVSVPTGAGDAGTYTVTVETENDTATTTVTVEPDGGGGGLSPNNPFGDSSNNPVDRSTVIDRVVEWNLNGEIGGTTYTRQEIIDFVVEWNLET
jgi:hypothetical protein